MTPDQRSKFFGYCIQQCDHFLATTEKRLLSRTWTDPAGNKDPIACMLGKKWHGTVIMSKGLGEILGFEVSTLDLTSFSHGIDGSNKQSYDVLEMYEMGLLIRERYNIKW